MDRNTDPFSMDINGQAKGMSKNGLSLQDLALTASNVFDKCCGAHTRGREAWQDVAQYLLAFADQGEEAEFQLSVSGTARGLCRLFYQSCGHPEEIEQRPLEEQGAWNAVVRHLVNVIDTDRSVLNIPEYEERIHEWYKTKHESQTLVLS